MTAALIPPPVQPEDEIVHAGPAEFYMVWTKGGRNVPRVTHDQLVDAQAEAARLARLFPHRRWFVLQAIERLWVHEAADRPPPTPEPTLEA